jgi:hypothetical protein
MAEDLLKKYTFAVDSIKASANGKPMTIAFSQGDVKTAILIINLTENDTALDLTGKKVRVSFKKSDGTSVMQDMTTGISFLDAAAGKIQIQLSTQALSARGNVRGQISITDEVAGLVAETAEFTFVVRESIVNTSIISTDELPIIEQTIEAAKVLESVDLQTIVNNTSNVNSLESEVETARGASANLAGRFSSVESSLAQNTTKQFIDMQGMALAEIPSAKLTESFTGVQPLIVRDNWLYGFKDNTTIVKSSDEGVTWQIVATAPYGSVHSIFWTTDGEVVITNGSKISKSSGWSANPSTITWIDKVTKSNETGVGIIPWAIDGDGQKFIATEYSGTDRSHSRYVWISLDAGETWNIVVDKYTIDPDNTSHMHGVCYDKWADRFFLSHGHGVVMGTYWSDDNGVTWNKIGGSFQPDAAPTTLFATDNGIVCGSDSNDAGLYGIARTSDPSKMVMKHIVRWHIEQSGVTGFAYRSVRDEKTGQVYVAFKSDHANVKPIIMAGTATSGSVLWKHDTANPFNFTHLAVTENKLFGIMSLSSVQTRIEADKPLFGNSIFDNTNTKRGLSRNTSSIAIGKNVEVSTANEIVIGENATLDVVSSKTNNVVIGTSAQGTARSVAIGNNAQSLNNSSDNVAIGNSAKVSAINAIAIGNGATVPAGSTGSIAIGNGTEASTGGVAFGIGSKTGTGTTNAVAVGSSSYAGTSAVGIGRLASAGTQQVAIGLSAISNFLNSIALGANVTTTATDQLNIGARHVEMKKVTEPVSVPVDSGRLFIKDDGAGKLQLCVRLGSTTIVLATQP